MACTCSDLVLNSCGCCCDSECLPPTASQGPVGPVGPVGPSGSNGTDGVNSYSVVSVAGVVPAIGNSVALTLENAEWVIDGGNLYLEGIGYYEAISHTDTTVTVENLGAPSNAAPATAIPIATGIGPAGYEGPALIAPLPIADGGTGEDNATDAFTALSPITTRGDVIIGTIAGVPVRLALGASGYVLSSDGTDVVWAANAPVATNITGILPIANGGTNANSAATARTNLDVPGLSTANAFVGTNTFDTNTGTFRVTSGVTAYLIASDAINILALYDFTGARSIDWNNRFIQGQWSQSQKAYVTASGATYTIPALSAVSNVETVISTYSLTGAQTITLPAGTDGRVVRVIDGAGNAGTNSITINRAGSDTIMGGTTFTINLNYGGVALIFVNATTNWVPFP